jgi:hypothetical protein
MAVIEVQTRMAYHNLSNATRYEVGTDETNTLYREKHGSGASVNQVHYTIS